MEIVASNDSPTSVFVACGGDGTAQAVAKQLIGKNSMLGILPLGSGNDFAKMLGNETDQIAYLDILLNGVPVAFDSITWDKGVCINTLGIGVDGLTNKYATKSKFLRGKLKYVFAAAKAILSISKSKVKVKINNESHEESFDTYLALATNGRWEGGSYQLSPNSSSNDGIFELHVAAIKSRIQLFYQFLRLSFFGSFSQHILKTYSCTKAKLQFDRPFPAHCDGEDIGFITDIEFKMNPGSLKVITKGNN